ncbi:YutD family protein [Liquorilactobacillus hordei]|uniref:YutD family protein n=1 Tax=Liquorilactobacillus hordei TaxID=468911 RepID=UPI001CBEE6A7|nr:YutD family protein [Liquorilactobacillus hordei]MBZ2406755.1 transcriptional regulator [Liquorilactobacillus hordei]
MNSEKKERREAQLAKKAETIKAYASNVQMESETQLLIDGHPYVIEKNFRNGFDVEKLKERFSQILTKYDYIVGDWGYDQLRLHGFYAADSKKGFPSQSIDHMQDYLLEYCNFGCAYFVLHNLDVTKPVRKSKKHQNRNNNKKKNIDSDTKTVRRKPRETERKKKPYTSEKKFEIRERNNRKENVAVSTIKRNNTRKRHFVIRQKNEQKDSKA